MLAIREMKIETNFRFHLTPVKMAKINKTAGHNAGENMNGNPHTDGGTVNCCVQSRKQLNISPAHDPAMPLLGTCSKNLTFCPIDTSQPCLLLLIIV